MIDQWFDNLYVYSNIGHDAHAMPFGFYWAPVSYITDKHYCVRFFDDETSSRDKIKLLEECNKDTFDNVDHPPFKEYNLESNELLYVSRCKLQKGPFPLVDSFCRIDSITTVKKEYIKPVHITKKGFVFLSNECHDFFIQWINWYFGYKVEEKFDEIIRLLRSEIGY